MDRTRTGRLRLGPWLVAAVASIALLAPMQPLLSADRGAGDPTPDDSTAGSDAAAASSWNVDTLRGRSGKLRILLVSARSAPAIDVLTALFGDSAARRPGVYSAGDSTGMLPFHLVNLVPFDAKENGRLGAYRMGFWPAERNASVSPAYANPDGFIEVTPENQDTHVSEHFRLRDFLTKDQGTVWPKYLVLDVELLDKLELLIDELRSGGTDVSRMSVMSGFRTPQYNQRGVGAGGRAQNSRHQYGDAADVFVDDDANGRMDDLNGDGRVNTLDARFLARAAERVERRFPDLTGGIGIYSATSAHGPFVHVDVRGAAARW
jgi:uncharacterized protein YcbK (DUF882 family)